MAQPVIQNSFSSGELSPSLYARVDLAKYHTGCALMRNFYVDYRGGASNRTGTKYIGRCIDSSKPNRLIPFQFSTLQTYTLVFGNFTMRVIMNGGFVLEPSFSIAVISQTNPGILNVPGHNFSNGDTVYLSIPSGMTQLDKKTLLVTSVSGNNFSLTDYQGKIINTTNYSAYLSGGIIARIFTLTTPYAAEDLGLLKYSQRADIMTLTHGAGVYQAHELTRTQHWIWTITLINFVPHSAAPTGCSAVASSSGSTTYHYIVTAIAANGVTESTQSNIAIVTSVTLSLTSGAKITISWTAVTDATAYKIYRRPEIIGAAPVTGSLFGFIGEVNGTGSSFIDNNIIPDFTSTPPQANNPFSGGNNPFCSAYYQQRQVFGGKVNAPDGIAFSKSGDFLNFDYSSPSKDNDSIEFNIASQQVNAIKHLVPMVSLIALTSSGAWRIDAGQQFDALTPTHLLAVPQAYNGCSDVPPIVINYDILYIQARGAIVRDLSYNFFVNIYTGAEMTVMSNHLFYGHQITEWAYAEEPFKIIWCIRNDGILLSFTYLKEQEVYGWSHHDTKGLFKSVCSIVEGQENAVYFVVERYINGEYVQFVERMASRQMNADPAKQIPADLSKAWFVDCGLQYPLVYPNSTLTPQSANGTPKITSVQIINGGNGYTNPVITDLSGSGAIFTVALTGGVITNVVAPNGGSNVIRPILQITDPTGSGAVLQAIVQNNVNMTGTGFTSGDVGKVVRINDGIGIIVAVLNSTNITVNLMTNLSSAWPASQGAWSMTMPIKTLTGLDHLEGEMVSILADGNVMAQQMVINGSIALSEPATAIVAGLSYLAQFQSLYLDVQTEGTIQSKRKKIPVVTVRVQDSRGLKLGPSFKDLVEIKERTFESMGQAIKPITGDERVLIPSGYTTQGQICAQQDQPLPATILGLIPEVTVGDTQ